MTTQTANIYKPILDMVSEISTANDAGRHDRCFGDGVYRHRYMRVVIVATWTR